MESLEAGNGVRWSHSMHPRHDECFTFLKAYITATSAAAAPLIMRDTASGEVCCG